MWYTDGHQSGLRTSAGHMGGVCDGSRPQPCHPVLPEVNQQDQAMLSPRLCLQRVHSSCAQGCPPSPPGPCATTRHSPYGRHKSDEW